MEEFHELEAKTVGYNNFAWTVNDWKLQTCEKDWSFKYFSLTKFVAKFNLWGI